MIKASDDLVSLIERVAEIIREEVQTTSSGIITNSTAVANVIIDREIERLLAQLAAAEASKDEARKKWADQVMRHHADTAKLEAAEARLQAMRKALLEPMEYHALYNLEGALYDIERFSAAGNPTDKICIDTIKRVVKQIAQAIRSLTEGETK